jgi:hexosaminidase
MKQICFTKFAIAVLLFCFGIATGTDNPKIPFLTPLRTRGFSLIPAPQQVELGALDVLVDGYWTIQSKIGTEDIAVKRLIQGAEELHKLSFSSSGKKKIILAISPGTVKGTADPALNEQGYLLRVTRETVEITGNSKTGLFYLIS